ncbi:MAG: hypothetical protein WCY58_02040 [Mariniphaga sp.]
MKHQFITKSLIRNGKMRSLFLLLAAFFFVAEGTGQLWIGGTSSDWHNPANWNPQTVPGAGASVIIRTASTVYKPVITQDVTIYSLQLPNYSSGELTVTNTAVLTITHEFRMNNNSTLNLNNGSLVFTGTETYMGYTNAIINVSNNGLLRYTGTALQVNGALNINGGEMIMEKGFTLSTNKIFTVTEGNISLYGRTNIFGTLNGGTGNFSFDGDQLNSDHFVNIGSGGRFFMAPVVSATTTPECDPETPVPPPSSGGQIDFHNTVKIADNARFLGGDALVNIYQDFITDGNAIITIHNGTLNFMGDVDVVSTAVLSITCKGSITITGNSLFESNGRIDVGDGNLSVGGQAVFANSGYFSAESGTIIFDGDVSIQNNNGDFIAGESTIYFNGGTFENSGDFDCGTSTFIFGGDGDQEITGTNSDITFYNLEVEDGSTVNSSQNVLVMNDMGVEDDSDFFVDPGLTLNVVGVVTGDPYVETNRPYIISLVIIDDNVIKAIFDDSLDATTAQNPNNYYIEDEEGNTIDYPTNPTLGGANNNEVTLTLGFIIQENVKYYLITNNVKNDLGYTVNVYHRKRFLITEPVDQWSWIGVIDEDWDKTGNWSRGTLPTLNSCVYIPVTPHDPFIYTTGHQIKCLKIDAGASLTIGPVGNLTVNNTITNNAGENGLLVDSDETGTGSLIQQENVSGSFRRYISGEKEHWQMISSPVAGQSISGDFTPTGGDSAYADNTRYDFYAWYEPDTSWVYLLNNDQPPTWITANGSTQFVSGRGYLVEYKDPHPIKTFQGTFHAGEVSVSVTKTTGIAAEFGYNLVGNPYPSSIDWKAEAGWNRSALENNNSGYDIWIWSESNLNYGAYNSTSASDEGTLGVSRYIAPTQGFFVKADQSGALSMNNLVRVHEGSGNWLKNASRDASIQTLRVSVVPESTPGSDEVMFEFVQFPESGGARKKFSFIPEAPTLYIPDQNAGFSIRRIGADQSAKVFPISFRAGYDDNYSLQIDFDPVDFDFLELLDIKTGERIDLTETQAYQFQAGPDDNSDRFVLQTEPGNFPNPHSAVPVQIYSSQGVLYVDMRLINGPYLCEVYSLAGQLLMKKQLQGGEIASFYPGTTHGIVIVHVYGEKGRTFQKVPVIFSR